MQMVDVNYRRHYNRSSSRNICVKTVLHRFQWMINATTKLSISIKNYCKNKRIHWMDRSQPFWIVKIPFMWHQKNDEAKATNTDTVERTREQKKEKKHFSPDRIFFFFWYAWRENHTIDCVSYEIYFQLYSFTGSTMVFFATKLSSFLFQMLKTKWNNKLIETYNIRWPSLYIVVYLGRAMIRLAALQFFFSV